MMLEVTEQQKNVRYGFFEFLSPKNPKDKTYQPSAVDGYRIDVDIADKRIPAFAYAVHADAEMTGANGANLVHFGNSLENGALKGLNRNSACESKAFTESDARNFKFEDGVLTILVQQWNEIRCGKWMWIAIYENS